MLKTWNTLWTASLVAPSCACFSCRWVFMTSAGCVTMAARQPEHRPHENCTSGCMSVFTRPSGQDSINMKQHKSVFHFTHLQGPYRTSQVVLQYSPGPCLVCLPWLLQDLVRHVEVLVYNIVNASFTAHCYRHCTNYYVIFAFKCVTNVSHLERLKPGNVHMWFSSRSGYRPFITPPPALWN